MINEEAHTYVPPAGEAKVISNEPVEKDPKYFYFVDKDGNVCKKLRGKTVKKKVKKDIINYFDKVNLTVPKILLNGFVSKKFRTVRKTGPNGGMIFLPESLVGNTYQVILIPKEDWIASQIGGF